MQRLQELRDRGVLSLNWRVDRQLSTPTAAVFVNYHTQTLVVAFRGSVTLGDWASNAKTVLPPPSLSPHRHPRLTPSPSYPHSRPHPHLYPNQVLPGDYANSRSFQACAMTPPTYYRSTHLPLHPPTALLLGVAHRGAPCASQVRPLPRHPADGALPRRLDGGLRG